jgi:hypothetical protein
VGAAASAVEDVGLAVGVSDWDVIDDLDPLLMIPRIYKRPVHSNQRSSLAT